MRFVAVLLASSAFVTSAFAQQWTFQGGKQTNNGSVSVKSVDGSTSQTATQNPTGAAAKVNQTAVTQPPTVVMQATAKLPVVIEGAACNATIDQVGIKSDLTILYTCQSNVWVRANNEAVVSENSACNAAYDRLALSADRTKIFSCQSGQWKAAGAGITAGGGRSQIWKALAGQSISCSMSVNNEGVWGTVYAYRRVDANGVPYVRIYMNTSGGSWDSGWSTAGQIGPVYSGGVTANAAISLHGINGTCSAGWSG